MKIIKNFVGGLAGAVALNVLHETLKRLDDKAPRVDLIGEEVISKGIKAVGQTPPKGDALFTVALAGDLLSNAVYCSLIGAGNKKNILLRGVGYGALAGLGALKLTGPIGLSDAPVTRTHKTEVLTVAYYTFGGLVAAMAMKGMRK